MPPLDHLHFGRLPERQTLALEFYIRIPRMHSIRNSAPIYAAMGSTNPEIRHQVEDWVHLECILDANSDAMQRRTKNYSRMLLFMWKLVVRSWLMCPGAFVAFIPVL